MSANVESLTPRQDAWLWRLMATGLAFALFGLGGLLLRVVVFPLQRLRSGDGATRQRRARAVISRTFYYFIRFLVRTGILSYEFEGAGALGRPGQLIIANHPSLLDVVFLIGYVRDANCVIKHSLQNNLFAGSPVKTAGYIPNDRNIEMLDDAARVLREGQTLIVFPEGTRTNPGQKPVFHRGACAIALRGASVITPVVIRMEPSSLTRDQPWYRIPRRRMHYRLDVGPDIDPATWGRQYSAPIAGRKMNNYLHEYFNGELGHHGPT